MQGPYNTNPYTLHCKNIWVAVTFNTLYIDPYNKFRLTSIYLWINDERYIKMSKIDYSMWKIIWM